MFRYHLRKNARRNLRAARHSTPLRVERLEGRDLPSAPVPPDIVSWYRAQGDASDFAGDNDGILINGTTFTAGKVGQAFLFDGSNDYVIIPDDASLEPGSNFTIEAWVNPSELGHGRPIAQKRTVGNDGGYTFETNGSSGGLQFVVWIGNIEHTLQTPDEVLAVDGWQHVAATYDGASLRIFVDGVQQAELSAPGVIDTSNDVDVVIGQNVVIPTFAWKGAIDEPSFYNRALSQVELQSIVDAGSEGKEFPDTYDAAGDFSLSGNPNGAWSYGWSPTLGGAFTEDVSSRSGQPHPELQSWDGPISSFFPVISKNISNATVVVGTVTWQPGQMVNHPGPGGEYSVLRWTAPKAGKVEFSASFSGADSTSTDVHVLFNETAISDGNVNGFGAGPTFSQSLVVEIGDTIDFVVGFGNGIANYSNDSTGLDARLAYVDGDPPTPEADLSVTISDAPEPVLVGNPVTYTVTVTNNGPSDSTGVTVVALGPPGQQFNSLTIPIGDLANGATRSFQVMFTPAAVGTFSATATVTANEADPNPTNNAFTETTTVAPRSTFELAQAQYEVREGEPFAVLTLRRAGDLSGTSRVDYTTVDGTAATPSGGRRVLSPDYTTSSGTLSFRPHANTAKIRVPIRDDGRIELDETFRVILSNPSAGTALGLISSAEVTIHDNDPAVEFAAATTERDEASPSNLNKIGVKLLSPSTKKVTVAYSVTGGSAVVGTDFNLPNTQTLIFLEGETLKYITVTLSNDTVYEGDETAIITLSSPINAFLGARTVHTFSIVDNDPQPPPQEPGSTPETALFIDLQTLPRQSFKDVLAGTLEKDTFRVHLDAGEYLTLDVDPEPIKVGAQVLFPGLASSSLVISAADGSMTPITVGPSKEPDTGTMTNNPAFRFQAQSNGDYLLKLETLTNIISGYGMHFHRIGVSENVPAPELLNVSGPMFAWFRDNAGSNDTVGITGPIGYGFTLTGPWQQTMQGGRNLKQQTLTLLPGSQFTLASPQGVELPLVANGKITIKTDFNIWGDMVGEVTTEAIKFPASLGIEPINDLLADAFGSDVSVGVLTADWRISLGGRVFAKGNQDKIEDITPFLAGVPYLRQKSPVTISAQIGEYTFDYAIQQDNPIEVVFDPGDPMLYLRADKIQNLRKPAIGLSRHGLLEFVRQRDPAADLVEEFGHGDMAPVFFGHVYVSGSVPFKIWYIPFEAHGDSVYNLDADRDGQFLAGLFEGDDLFRANFDDLPNSREVLHDIQAGNNGSLLIKPESEDAKIKYAVHAGEATWVFNGPAETFWFRGQRGTGGSLFDGTPLDFLNVRSTDVLEAMVHGGGDFILRATASYGVGKADLEFGLTISNEGIVAQVTGKLEWSVTVDLRDFGLGRPGGRARADIEGTVAMEIDGNQMYFSGSVKARGRVWVGDKKWVDEEIDPEVRSHGFRFDFPLVGDVDWNPFD